MKRKKMLSTCMAAVTALSFMAGIPTTASEPEEIVFAFHMGNTIDLEPVEDALNAILIPEINVKVDLQGYSWSSYNNQISLMQAGGDQLDVFGMCPDFSTFLANNQLLPMDGIIDEYAAETRELIGEDFLKSCSKGGSVYAIPRYGSACSTLNLVIRKDIVDELALPVDQLVEAETFEEYLANMELLTEIFTTVHEAHPELILAPSSHTPNSLRITEVPFVDGLGDSLGVLLPDDDTTVVNLYETEEFKELAEYVYEWNQAGFILEDATTTQEGADTYLKNGRSFAHFELSSSSKNFERTKQKATGVEVVAKSLVKPFVTTNRVNNSAFGISVTSEHPEASMKFINEMFTNEDIMHILAYGVEGVHWEEKGDGFIGYPEGVTAENSTFELGMYWYFGNYFLLKTWEGNQPGDVEGEIARNKAARASAAMGFSYDSSVVATELAGIGNVTSQYLPGIFCGVLNPEEAIPEFTEALKAAGIDTVIAEKQAQYDAWRNENK